MDANSNLINMLADDSGEMGFVFGDEELSLLEEINNPTMDETDDDRIERIFNDKMYC